MPNYPAPLLAADRPVGATAPGSAFVLPATVTGAATGTAAVAEYMRQVSDGQSLWLTGLGLSGASFPVYTAGRFQTTATTGDSLKACVQLPRKGLGWDFGLAWVLAADGISAPVALNRTTLTWAEQVVPVAGAMQVMGRNLAHGNAKGGASYVIARPAGGGEFRLLTGTAANSYRAEIPVGDLPVGTYTGWAHNGHGQDYGWSKPFTFQVVARQAHALTRDFGPATLVELSATDGAANAATLNNAYATYAHFTTRAGSFPLSGNVGVRAGVRWACATVEAGGRTTLVATNWVRSDLGMIGTNGVTMAVLDGIYVDNPNQDIGADALIVLRSPRQVWLRRSGGRWQRPYDVTDYGSYSIPKEAQVLRIENGQQVYGDELDITGTGSHVGSRRGGTSGQVFLRNYTHRLTNGADHALYKLNTNGLLVLGMDFQDLDPDSGDGLTRGSGRGIKCGGQGGANQNGHFEAVNGRLLGPLFTGINPYYDRNQGEIFLWEGNRTTWQGYVVSATATTLTFSQPVLSRLSDVQAEALQADDPAAGVLPGLHLLRISTGPGLWQMRGIEAVSGNVITLDEPLAVLPTTASLIQVGCFTRGNTVVAPNVSGKRAIVDSPDFGILTLINYYGGMHDTIVDAPVATNVRHGFIFTPTTHQDGYIDTVTFCEMLSPVIDGVRWGERYESYGREEHPEWNYPASGLGAIRVSNPRITGVLEAGVVFKTPRLDSEVSAHWAAPPIDGVSRDGVAPATYLNDYKTPSNPTNFPPIPVAAGTLTNFTQLAPQSLMPDYSVVKKFSFFRWLAPDLTLSVANAPWLNKVLKLVSFTVPGSTGANSQTAYQGAANGQAPGGTLQTLRRGGTYYVVAGVTDGTLLVPNAVEVLQPTITALSTVTAQAGDTLTITGLNLLNITFAAVGGAAAYIDPVTQTNTSMRITIPLLASIGSGIVLFVAGLTGCDSNSTLTITSSSTTPTTFTVATTNYRYSRGVARPSAAGSATQPAALAELPFPTNAPTVVVRFDSTYPDGSGGYALKVGTTTLATGKVTTPSGQDVTVTMPSGSGIQELKIITDNTQRGNEQGPVWGVSVVSITIPAGYTGALTTPAPAARVVGIEGDSRSVGYGPPSPATQSYVPLLRSTAQDVQAFNYGSAQAAVQLSGTYYASTKKAQLLAAYSGVSDARHLLALDINDWRGATLTPPQFRDLFISYIGRVSTDLPALKMGVILSTTCQQEADGVTFGGYTLEQFRQAERDAATYYGLPVLEAGSLLSLSGGDFADGLHYSAQGYAKLVSSIQTLINNAVVPAAAATPVPLSFNGTSQRLVVADSTSTLNGTAGLTHWFSGTLGSISGYRALWNRTQFGAAVQQSFEHLLDGAIYQNFNTVGGGPQAGDVTQTVAAQTALALGVTLGGPDGNQMILKTAAGTSTIPIPGAYSGNLADSVNALWFGASPLGGGAPGTFLDAPVVNYLGYASAGVSLAELSYIMSTATGKATCQIPASGTFGYKDSRCFFYNEGLRTPGQTTIANLANANRPANIFGY